MPRRARTRPSSSNAWRTSTPRAARTALWAGGGPWRHSNRPRRATLRATRRGKHRAGGHHEYRPPTSRDRSAQDPRDCCPTKAWQCAASPGSWHTGQCDDSGHADALAGRSRQPRAAHHCGRARHRVGLRQRQCSSQATSLSLTFHTSPHRHLRRGGSVQRGLSAAATPCRSAAWEARQINAFRWAAPFKHRT